MPTARFQTSFAAGVLGPGIHGRMDIAKYDVGLKVGFNCFIHAHGGISNRAGTEFVAEVMDHTKKHRILPFKRDETQNHILLMGDLSMKVIDMGLVVQDGGGDYSTATPFASADLVSIDYAQSVDVMYMAHHLHFPQEMRHNSITDWVFSDLPIDPTLPAPTGVTVTPKTAGSETYTYKVSPVEDGIEGFASIEGETTAAELLANAGAENVISWTGTASEYNVYRERSGVFGFIGFTDDTSFTDDNISADLTVTPVTAADIFTGAGEYPSVVTLHKQRLLLANSINQPETIWASRVGAYRNFTKSRILKADDRLETDLTGESINRVNGLLQLRELLAFASSGEFSLSGPDGALSATNPVQTQHGYAGSIKIKPLVVNSTALFVDSTGRAVRDLQYAFERDGYPGDDLSIFSYHYFENKQIAGWCYARNPFSVVWVYLDDGTLLSLTYNREHQVWAWCEHDVGGVVESVASVKEGTRDAVYLIVKRLINGNEVRYVERMRERTIGASRDGFFVDCGITHSGVTATDTITGLDHLEGETVVALADGNVVEGLVVTGGSVTLPRAAHLVHVGLRYYSEFETLPPAIVLQDVGSARGRPTSVSKVRVQLEKTRGISAGTNRDKMTRLVQTGGDLARDIELYTGMVDLTTYPGWDKDGTVIIRQDYPLPMTCLGISPEFTVGRT